jgi:hypothetical protein
MVRLLFTRKQRLDDLYAGCLTTGWRGSKKRLLRQALAALALAAVTLPFLSCFATGAAAVQVVSPGRTMVVVIDRIGIDDLGIETSPNYMRLAQRGAFSLMNARVKYDQYGQGSYLVIGASGRAIGGPNIGLAFDSAERLKSVEGGSVEAGNIYEARTGRRAPRAGVVNLFIEEMKKKSDTSLASSKPGLLGRSLVKGKRSVAVLGNADSEVPESPVDLAPPADVRSQQNAGVALATPAQGPSYPMMSFLHREVVAIAMNSGGAVRLGNVSSALDRRSADGSGIRTDFGRLEADAAGLLRSSDVLVIDLGQTSRVDEQADFSTEERLAEARLTALRECDAALGRLAGMLDLSRDTIIVCTPTPTRKMILDGELLTPLLVAGRGFDTGGRLHSATTRRTGLVSNYDIAPTVLKSQGLEAPADMDGRPLTAAGAKPDIEGLKSFRDRAVSIYTSRKALVRLYVIAAMCVIALFFLVMLIRRDLIEGHPYFWSVALLALLAGPFAWLVVPALGPVPQYAAVLAAVGISMLVAAASLLLRGTAPGPGTLSGALLRPVFGIATLTLVVVLVDILFKSPYMTLSAFGSDVILGDRYYGVGNLFMGFTMGAASVVATYGIFVASRTFNVSWKRYLWAGAVLGGTALIVGLPGLGAEMGGLIAIGLTGLITLLKLAGKPLTLKRLGFVAVVLVLCVGAILLVDALLPGSASHVGRAIDKIRSSGLSAGTSQLARKLGANWLLTFASIWRLLLLFAFVAWLVFNWKFQVFKSLKENVPLYAGFVGLAVGLVIAWLVNDSGIEAAAAASVFLFVPCFLMLIPWPRRSDGHAEAE